VYVHIPGRRGRRGRRGRGGTQEGKVGDARRKV